MAGSSFGHLFKITTFGESHGGAVGVVIDGATPGLELREEDIQKELDRRKPGQNFIATPRKEADQVHILSGVFEGKTTGTPILLILYNTDARPQAYDDIKDKFRPGHADFTYLKKYGIRDYRGSGRASGRETAGRVAAGAVAKKLLQRRGVSVLAYTVRAAGVACRQFDEGAIEQNPLRACDAEAAKEMETRLLRLQEEKDSAGGIVECRVRGLPPGLGEPVFDKLDAELAHAMLSLGAVKGIEFGAGFAAVDMKGSEHNDWMDQRGFLTNHAGGIIGGISTGAELLFRIAVKPVSSIAKVQKTITVEGKETEIRTEGRHDTCILPRLVPVVEAMTALVLEDHFKLQAALHA
jgi:chorismate synthase